MSIREKLKQWKRFAAGATAAVLCAGLLAGCTGKNPAGSSDGTAAQEGPQRYSTIFYDAFDTVTQVIAYCDSEEEFTRQMDALHADLLEYHQLYDIYNDYDGVTNIKTINDNAGVEPVKVSREIIDLLLEAKRLYAETGGKVNVAMGSVLSIWHDYRESGLAEPELAELPPYDMLEQAGLHTDLDQVIIDEQTGIVYIEERPAPSRCGAIAKGYACQLVKQELVEAGFESFVISAGRKRVHVGRAGGRRATSWLIGSEP